MVGVTVKSIELGGWTQRSGVQLVLVLMLALAGCATPNELRQGKPTLELSSSKAARTVAICIADNWENSGSFGAIQVSMRETQSGYMITIMCDSNTCVMADVTPLRESRSKTSVYTNALLADDFLDYAKKCQ